MFSIMQYQVLKYETVSRHLGHIDNAQTLLVHAREFPNSFAREYINIYFDNKPNYLYCNDFIYPLNKSYVMTVDLYLFCFLNNYVLICKCRGNTVNKETNIPIDKLSVLKSKNSNH